METPRHWRTQPFRYGLKIEVGADGKPVGLLPTGVRNYVATQENRLPAEQDKDAADTTVLSFISLVNQKVGVE